MNDSTKKYFFRNFIYCLHHDSVSDTSTIDRYDMEHGRIEHILKTEKTVKDVQESESADPVFSVLKKLLAR